MQPADSVDPQVRYVRSPDFLARDIGGHTVLIPLAGGIGARDEEVFSLNATGAAVWRELDGSASLGQIAVRLAARYGAASADVERDALTLVRELLDRGMVRAVGD